MTYREICLDIRIQQEADIKQRQPQLLSGQRFDEASTLPWASSTEVGLIEVPEEAIMMSKDSDPKQWYIEHRFMRQEEVTWRTGLTIDRVVGANGNHEFFLCHFGTPIGRLDPKRRWAQKLILQQEQDDKAAESGTKTAHNDGTPDRGESGECQEAGNGSSEGL